MSLHHLAVTTIDLSAGRRFYDAFLGAIGYKSGYAGDTVCTWEGPGPEILLYPVEGDDRSRHTHGRPGWQHAAFQVADRAMVNAAEAVVVEAGGAIVHPAQEYDYMPGYFAVFLEDPDGVRWEVMTTQ